MLTLVDRLEGCLTGCVLGDALCAPYEGGPLERLTWAVMGRTLRFERRYSDDTQMTLDLARSLVECGGLDLDHLAQCFAAGYSWTRGYGPGAAKILKKIRNGEPWSTANTSVYPEGSFGNGAAMRAPILGLLFSGETLEEAIVATSSITHAHPVGIDGARAVAHVTLAIQLGIAPGDWVEVARASCKTTELINKLDKARQLSGTQDAKNLGNSVAAVDSVPTAIYLASCLADADFDDVVVWCRKIGGDTDTIAAIAGSLWGAYRGASQLPDPPVEGRSGMKNLAQQLAELRLE